MLFDFLYLDLPRSLFASLVNEVRDGANNRAIFLDIYTMSSAMIPKETKC
jgi:hypothetical protein